MSKCLRPPTGLNLEEIVEVRGRNHSLLELRGCAASAMRYMVCLLLLASVAFAEPSRSYPERRNFRRTEKRELNGPYGLRIQPAIIDAVHRAEAYSRSRQNVLPWGYHQSRILHRGYGAPKVPEVVKGHGLASAPISNHLYQSAAPYTNKYQFEISQPVPSQLLYSEHKTINDGSLQQNAFDAILHHTPSFSPYEKHESFLITNEQLNHRNPHSILIKENENQNNLIQTYEPQKISLDLQNAVLNEQSKAAQQVKAQQENLQNLQNIEAVKQSQVEIQPQNLEPYHYDAPQQQLSVPSPVPSSHQLNNHGQPIFSDQLIQQILPAEIQGFPRNFFYQMDQLRNELAGKTEVIQVGNGEGQQIIEDNRENNEKGHEIIQQQQIEVQTPSPPVEISTISPVSSTLPQALSFAGYSFGRLHSNNIPAPYLPLPSPTPPPVLQPLPQSHSAGLFVTPTPSPLLHIQHQEILQPQLQYLQVQQSLLQPELNLQPQPLLQPVDSQPLQPVLQPVQPTIETIQPVLQPVQPTLQSIQPVEAQPQPIVPLLQPIEPSAQPVQPLLQTVEPSPTPIQTVLQPVEPSPQPIPILQPVVPSPQPIQPLLQPVEPSPTAILQPIEPQPQPAQPLLQPVPSIETVQPILQPIAPQPTVLASTTILPASASTLVPLLPLPTSTIKPPTLVSNIQTVRPLVNQPRTIGLIRIRQGPLNTIVPTLPTITPPIVSSTPVVVTLNSQPTFASYELNGLSSDVSTVSTTILPRSTNKNSPQSTSSTTQRSVSIVPKFVSTLSTRSTRQSSSSAQSLSSTTPSTIIPFPSTESPLPTQSSLQALSTLTLVSKITPTLSPILSSSTTESSVSSEQPLESAQESSPAPEEESNPEPEGASVGEQAIPVQRLEPIHVQELGQAQPVQVLQVQSLPVQFPLQPTLAPPPFEFQYQQQQPQIIQQIQPVLSQQPSFKNVFLAFSSLPSALPHINAPYSTTQYFGKYAHDIFGGNPHYFIKSKK